MAKSSTYSAKNVTSMIDGQRVIGFWDGDDAVSVEPLDDAGVMIVGADGSSIFSQSANDGAKITLKLQHTSAAHRLLHQKWARQRTAGIRVRGFGFSVQDVDSGEGGAADDCYIMTAPGDQKGNAATERVWVLVTGLYVPMIPFA